MEKGKQVGGSSSSFTTELFGPKETPKSSSSSTGLFSSVFGPPSTGIGKHPSHSGRNQDYGSQYGNVRNGTSDYTNQKMRDDSREKNSIYQTETAEPCYFSSSIYYGGQEVYSPTGQTTNSQQNHFKKDGEDDDANGNNLTSASRGNWWQGSLYY